MAIVMATHGKITGKKLEELMVLLELIVMYLRFSAAISARGPVIIDLAEIVFGPRDVLNPINFSLFFLYLDLSEGVSILLLGCQLKGLHRFKDSFSSSNSSNTLSVLLDPRLKVLVNNEGVVASDIRLFFFFS